MSRSSEERFDYRLFIFAFQDLQASPVAGPPLLVEIEDLREQLVGVIGMGAQPIAGGMPDQAQFQASGDGLSEEPRHMFPIGRRPQIGQKLPPDHWQVL
jgi:hypothetical protein